MFVFVCLFVCFFNDRLKCDIIRCFQIFCSLFYLELWKYAQFTIMKVQCRTVCALHDACNTAHAICSPWTASKSDRATKIIVTLLFSDRFQKNLKILLQLMKSFLGKSTSCVISSNPKKIQEVGARPGGPLEY